MPLGLIAKDSIQDLTSLLSSENDGSESSYHNRSKSKLMNKSNINNNIVNNNNNNNNNNNGSAASVTSTRSARNQSSSSVFSSWKQQQEQFQSSSQQRSRPHPSSHHAQQPHSRQNGATTYGTGAEHGDTGTNIAIGRDELLGDHGASYSANNNHSGIERTNSRNNTTDGTTAHGDSRGSNINSDNVNRDGKETLGRTTTTTANPQQAPLVNVTTNTSSLGSPSYYSGFQSDYYNRSLDEDNIIKDVYYNIDDHTYYPDNFRSRGPSQQHNNSDICYPDHSNLPSVSSPTTHTNDRSTVYLDRGSRLNNNSNIGRNNMPKLLCCLFPWLNQNHDNVKNHENSQRVYHRRFPSQQLQEQNGVDTKDTASCGDHDEQQQMQLHLTDLTDLTDLTNLTNLTNVELDGRDIVDTNQNCAVAKKMPKKDEDTANNEIRASGSEDDGVAGGDHDSCSTTNSHVLGERLSDRDRQAVLARLRLAQPECQQQLQQQTQSATATTTIEIATREPLSPTTRNSRSFKDNSLEMVGSSSQTGSSSSLEAITTITTAPSIISPKQQSQRPLLTPAVAAVQQQQQQKQQQPRQLRGILKRPGSSVSNNIRNSLLLRNVGRIAPNTSDPHCKVDSTGKHHTNASAGTGKVDKDLVTEAKASVNNSSDLGQHTSLEGDTTRGGGGRSSTSSGRQSFRRSLFPSVYEQTSYYHKKQQQLQLQRSHCNNGGKNDEDPEMIMPSTQAPKPPVRFSPMARVITVTSRHDMTPSEKGDIWWQRNDYEDFRRTGRIITRAMLEGGSEIWLASSPSSLGSQTNNSHSRTKLNSGNEDDDDSDENNNNSSKKSTSKLAKEKNSVQEDKWWHRFGHSRRGLEHVVSVDEGRQRQLNVKSAIRAVLDEQARQQLYRRATTTSSSTTSADKGHLAAGTASSVLPLQDHQRNEHLKWVSSIQEKLRNVSLHYTQWARDLALAAGASDADAVESSFAEDRRSREFYLLKMINRNNNNNPTSTSVTNNASAALTSNSATRFNSHHANNHLIPKFMQPSFHQDRTLALTATGQTSAKFTTTPSTNTSKTTTSTTLSTSGSLNASSTIQQSAIARTNALLLHQRLDANTAAQIRFRRSSSLLSTSKEKSSSSSGAKSSGPAIETSNTGLNTAATDTSKTSSSHSAENLELPPECSSSAATPVPSATEIPESSSNCSTCCMPLESVQPLHDPDVAYFSSTSDNNGNGNMTNHRPPSNLLARKAAGYTPVGDGGGDTKRVNMAAVLSGMGAL